MSSCDYRNFKGCKRKRFYRSALDLQFNMTRFDRSSTFHGNDQPNAHFRRSNNLKSAPAPGITHRQEFTQPRVLIQTFVSDELPPPDRPPTLSTTAEMLNPNGGGLLFDQRKRYHFTPHALCEVLVQRGLGDPRERSPEQPKNPLPYLLKRKRQERNNTFYLEKLKGRARLDYDNANAKAYAFIEQQKLMQIRTASANYRQRYNVLTDINKESETNSVLNSNDENVLLDDDEEEGSKKRLNGDLIARINTWLTDVEEAKSEGTTEKEIEDHIAQAKSEHKKSKSGFRSISLPKFEHLL